MYASSTGLAPVVKVILASDATNINATTIKVCSDGCVGVGVLVPACNPAPCSQDGWTALSRAAFRGHAHVVTQLCSHGADPAILNKVCRMPVLRIVFSLDLMSVVIVVDRPA